MSYNKLFFILTILLFSLTSVFSIIDVSDYTVNVESQKDNVLNSNIDSTFTFTVKNTMYSSQNFNLNISPNDGWDIILSEE